MISFVKPKRDHGWYAEPLIAIDLIGLVPIGLAMIGLVLIGYQY